jgi:GxxExxY protein
MKNKIFYPDLSYKINGILYKVHNRLGRYCNEKQYSDMIEELLKKEGIKFEREKILPKMFEGEKEGRNKIDFLIEEKIILEIKAKTIIEKSDYYQIMRYLKILNKKLGFLVNFRNRYLRVKRVINPEGKI